MGAVEPLGQAGNAISMYVNYPGGGSGKLTVDPDGVESLINHLEQGLVKLRVLYRQGQELTEVEPPGDDPFSPIAVADIKRTAGEEPGGHLYANQKAQQVYQAMIDNLKASLAAYRATDDGSAQSFKGDT